MREDGISEVTGTILLCALVIALAAAGMVFLTGAVLDEADYLPQASFRESASGEGLYHTGGDALTKADIRIFAKAKDITDETTIREAAWDIWHTGELLYLGGHRTSEITIIGRSNSGREVLLYEGLKKG